MSLSIVNDQVYNRLRCRARTILRRESAESRVEPDDLVQEALLRIAASRECILPLDAAHLLALATVVMRHILVDNARSPNSPRRNRWVSIDVDLPAATVADDSALFVTGALQRLAVSQQRLYQVVKMRFFWGLDTAEIASTLSISGRTVRRDWKTARRWLRRELTEKRPLPGRAQTRPQRAVS